MKSIEVQAKTIDEAIEDGLGKLGASYDEVDIEVLGSGGMFKKAKVRISLKEGVQTAKESPKTAEPVQITPIKQVLSEKIKTVEPNVIKTQKIDEASPKRFEKPAPAVQSPAIPVSPGESAKFDKCTSFVKKLLELLENDSVVTTLADEKSYKIEISGENVGRLIGKNGEALNALQTLVSSIAISNSHGDNKRVYVNIENYKEKRSETLAALAHKKAEFVKQTGKTVKLEPMNSRDRAIMHSALQNVEGIRTYSIGKDPGRRLCIASAEAREMSGE